MDLSRLEGNHLRGEILTATVSGVASTKKELVELFDRSVPSVDIITTKSFQVRPNPGNREPIVCSPSPGDFGNSVGLRNPGMDVIIPELREIREKGMRALLCVSVSANSAEDFITLIKASDPVADLIELNFSCPHAAAGFGAAIGSDINIAREYVHRIQEAYPERKAKLIIKLTPNVDNIGKIAKAVIDEGADGISAINTVGPKLYTEPRTGSVILNNKVGGKGGASGEWVKEEALRCIREIREAIGDGPLILGMGGVSTPEDARRMIAAGADSVGIGSALSRVHPQDWEKYFHAIKTGSPVDGYLSNENALVYTPHTILKREEFPGDVILLTVDGELECAPGEFVFLWVPGKGEKPFSVAYNKPLKFLIKKRGEFTKSLFSLVPGDTVYTRGLYGSPMKHQRSSKAILVAGGTGAAVLPLIAEELEREGTEMDIRVGVSVKDGKDPLEEELSAYGKYTSVPDDGKPGRVLDTLGEEDFSGDTAFYIVGPSALMMKAAEKAEALGQDPGRIYLSMEKNTMCGIGMCGECVCGGHLPCKEGTFFTWETLKEQRVSL